MERLPLHLAAKGGHKETVQFLVGLKVDAEAKGSEGLDPPSSSRAKRARKRWWRYCSIVAPPLNQRITKGPTPLHLAAEWGRKKTVTEILIKKGADLHLRKIKPERPLANPGF